MKESPITIVFIAPKRKRNCLWSFILRDCCPISAACDAPMPGRNAVKGEAIIDAREEVKIDFFDSLIFLRGLIF